MNRFVRVLALLFAVIALFTALPWGFLQIYGEEQPPELDDGSSALIYHNESGTIIYKSGEEQVIPAGPAPRLLTALIVSERYAGALEQKVTVHKKVSGLASSTMSPGLKGGELIPVYDLLCAMLIANSDDAVYALAFALFEGADDAPLQLLDAINKKAKALGMKDSGFLNITGNDPKNEEQGGNYSSLNDLLTLSLAVQKNKEITAICAIDDLYLDATDKSGKRHLLTRNYLLSAKRLGGYTYKYATGLAANEGKYSGYHVLATAQIDNKHFTCVVVGAKEKYAAFLDAAALFKWADNNFSYKRVLDTVSVLGEISVSLSGDSDYVTVVPQESISAFLPNDADIVKDVRIVPTLAFEKLTAPVYEGLIAGEVTVFYKGEEVGRTKLVTTGSLSASTNQYYMNMVLKFMKTPAFLSVMGILVLFLIACVLISARVRYLRHNRPSDLHFVYEEDEPVFSPIKESGTFAGLVTGKERKKEHAQGSEQQSPKPEEAKQEGEPLKNEAQGAPTEGQPGSLQEKKQESLAQEASEEPVQSVRRVRLTGAKRLPGKEGEPPAKQEQQAQGSYRPTGWAQQEGEEEQ